MLMRDDNVRIRLISGHRSALRELAQKIAGFIDKPYVEDSQPNSLFK
ncbi:hypothetical protein [Shewanella sedimentimangrovi]|uniref:Uncharacterized protein n=1 Tax=Shewanella sedimentimangrovi TaxID=2814293 RepID=A0ABX7R444_9GAMM|nr:hypothetical protein [Shewanella sedimentimangrovi]QSX38607.1 hypothetical protein JYB85_07280 [Shewanella sedimentimangrovi]